MTEPSDFAAVRERLRLQVFDATELGILELSIPAEERPRVQFVAAELYVGLRNGDEGFVTVEQADAWNVPFTDALKAAFDSVPPLEIGDAREVMEVTDEQQVAALFLDPSRAAPLAVIGDLAIVPLAQTRMILTGTDDERGFAQALTVADELLADGSRLASIHPVGDKNGQWFPFPWRDRFPALADAISRITREFGVRGYKEQAGALNAGDVRVLEPKLDKLESGVTVTFATWLSGTAALLPVVDNVFVVSAEGKIGVMGFAQFIEQAGSAVVRTELAPIRYYIPETLRLDAA
ncbi:hypothetical protein [Microbacterium sp. Bi121]|uniref:hypothetical protein n=1 Tax=Microbacterium sp. Bi121 TaxID=2822348 RepID=UPI001D3BBF17|nr:hypothetical protein [Microbacterium sp. Bi121]CAH0123083.1 hypothetical protein SRABI121_00262 [Microbacterium sp. Bi121]